MTINKYRLTRIVHLAVVVLAGLVTVMAVNGLVQQLTGQQELTALLDRYEAPDRPDDNNKEKSAQDIQAEEIDKRHVFSVEKAKGLSLKLMGILGELVYFQGENKGFEVGQIHKDAKIKRIGPDWVELEFDGKEKKLYVFTDDKGAGPAKPSGGPTPRGAGPRPPAMPGNIELTPEKIEQFKSMPAEMRQKALERMPAELREKIEKEL